MLITIGVLRVFLTVFSRLNTRGINFKVDLIALAFI